MPAGKITSINTNMFSLKYIKNLYNKNKKFFCLLAVLIRFCICYFKFVLTGNHLIKI